MLTAYKTKKKVWLLHDRDIKPPSILSEHIMYTRISAIIMFMLKLFLAANYHLLAVVVGYSLQLT